MKKKRFPATPADRSPHHGKVGAVIYCRVSTKEQVSNLSLPTQEEACRAYCEREGWVVDRVFLERGESAKTADRTELIRMLEHLRVAPKGSLHFCVVYNLQRFSRDIAAHYDLKARLAKMGLSLRSATETAVNDSSEGQLLEGVLASVAAFDNNVRRERTVAGMKAALNLGRWVFKTPIGFVATPGTGLSPDPDRAPLVARAFGLVASGSSVAESLRSVTKMGLRTAHGRPFGQESFRSMLRNPIYVGRVVVDAWGIDRASEFPGIVLQEIFDRVQAVLSGRPPGPAHARARPDFPLRGFVRCGCGRPLTGSWSTGRRGARYAYYHCVGGARHARVARARLEEKFEAELVATSPAPEDVAVFRKLVLEVWEQEQGHAQDDRATAEQRIRALFSQQETLEQKYLFDGAIDAETYQRQTARLRGEIAQAREAARLATTDSLEIDSLLDLATSAIGNTAIYWKESTLAGRQALQHFVFPTGLEYDGKSFLETRTSWAFSYLNEISRPRRGLVAPTGIEPVL